MSSRDANSPNVILRLKYAPHESDMKTPFAKEKYGRPRRFYSCAAKRNYVNYVNDGSKEKIDYVMYSGDSEKSYGLFDGGGLMDEKQREQLRKKLRNTKSVIWYGVMSFTTEFGNKHIKDNADAMRMMNMEMPKFLESAGLKPENITWYAGLHENTKHKHIHFSFYENAPCRYRQRGGQKLYFSDGYILPYFLSHIKVKAEMRLSDINAGLRAARDNVTGMMKSVLFSAMNKKNNLAAIQELMWDLIPLLPEDGRLSYASENMESLRPRIRKIVDLLIKSSPELYAAFNTFCNEATERDERAKKMPAAQKVSKRYWGGYMTADRVLEDVYKRFGNYVINTARVFKEKEKPGGKANSRIERKTAKKNATSAMLTHCLNLSAMFERDAMDAFRDYIKRLREEEIKIAKEQRQNENEID